MSNRIPDFIKEIQYKSGLTLEKIAKELGYSRVTLSRAINSDTENKDVLHRIKAVYPNIEESKNPDRDYRDSYLSALEREIGYLKEKLEVNLAEMEERQKAVAAMVRVALMNLEKTRSIQEKVSVDRISVENNKLIAELLEKN